MEWPGVDCTGLRSNNWSTLDEEVFAEKNTCLQGRSLCAFVVRWPPFISV